MSVSACRRHKILFSITGIVIIALFNFAPIAQDPSYHRFADQRRVFGVGNFYNIISNLPFIVIGIMGMHHMTKKYVEASWLASLKPFYFTFFAGVLLTGVGSSYYHHRPDNHTLLWDRLPMTVSFMALFSAIVGEYISLRGALKLAVPLLVTGLVSVIYWYVTELDGRGDLRLYALVQFIPIILIPVILWLFTPTVNINRPVWSMLAVYAVAKTAEFYDTGLFRILGFISGHSIKHLFAALGALFIYLALRRRKGGLEGRP